MNIRRPRITVRTVQITLGLLWLLDGALQLQRQMFTSGFATGVIEQSAIGQPKFSSSFTHFFVRLFLLHPAIFNSLVAVTQLGLGGLIIWKKTTKLGLICSMGWGLFVWVIGESFGGILSTHTLLLMGAPGAALLYVIIALAVLPRQKSEAENVQLPAPWLAIVWACLWIGGAIYQLLPGQNSAAALSAMISGNGVGAPGWLSALDSHVANTIGRIGNSAASMHMTANQMAQMRIVPASGYWLILALAGIQLFVGLAVFGGIYLRRAAVILGIALAISYWVIGQSLGGYYTGLATDPNSAPLFVLIGVILLSSKDIDKMVSGFFNKIEAVIT